MYLSLSIDGEHLHIRWNETDHEGIIPLQFLRENSYGTEAIEAAAGLRDNEFFKVSITMLLLNLYKCIPIELNTPVEACRYIMVKYKIFLVNLICLTK